MNMFRRRNLSKTTESLEQRTQKSSWFRNALGGFGLLAASFLPGCLSNAPYYRPAENCGKSIAAFENDYDVSNPNTDDKNMTAIVCRFVESMKGKSPIESYPCAGPDPGSNSDCVNFAEQNRYLASLLEKKLPRLLSYALQKNTDHGELTDYDAADEDEVMQTKCELAEFEQNLGKLGPESREKLQRNFRNKKDFAEAYAWNLKALAVANRYLTALADAHTIEGRLDEVNRANEVSAAIVASLSGYDAYGNCSVKINGRVEREGRLALDEVLKNCDDPSVKNKIDMVMERIKERSEKCADETRHIITNNYFADVLKLAWKAHKDGALSGLEYQSVVRCLTRDAAEAMSGIEENNVTIGGMLVSLSPLCMYDLTLVKEAALSRDWYAPGSDEERSALKELLEYGNAVKNGRGTTWNLRGSNGVSRTYLVVDSIMTPIWLGAMATGGVLGYNALNQKEEREQPPKVPTSGGETGGPGTG